MAAAPDDDRARDRRRAGGRGAPHGNDRHDADPPRAQAGDGDHAPRGRQRDDHPAPATPARDAAGPDRRRHCARRARGDALRGGAAPRAARQHHPRSPPTRLPLPDQRPRAGACGRAAGGSRRLARPRESVSAMRTQQEGEEWGAGPLLDHASHRPAACCDVAWRPSNAQKLRVSERSRPPLLALLLTALLALTISTAGAQPKREDPLQSEQKKLQQTQKRLKEEREKAAAARARETSLLAELEEIERRLAEKQTEVARLADAQREQAEVDREAAKRRTLLAKVGDERAYHERMVGELTEASRRLEAFIQELQDKQRKLAKAPPPKARVEPPGVGFGSLRGRLPWPTAGRIVVPFGAQVHPRFGTRTFRNGVDIEAAEGTDVTAVYGGHVIYTGWFKGYGNLIIVDHGTEYYTLYAHIAEIEVKEGEDVRQGQRIGTVGDTASLAGPRLYFEVRYQGKPQNPVEWLGHRG